VLANVLLWLATAFAPGSNGDFTPPVDNPLGWHAGDTALHVVQGLGMVCLVTAFLAALASLATRYRRGDAQTRAQLRWLLLALAVIAVTLAAPTPAAAAGVGVAVNVAATVLLPVTLAVALTRAGYALPRILVYGLLSTLLLTGYVALVALAEAVFGTGADPTAALVAAAVVAVAAAPLRARLQRGVDRLVYGGRGDPYAALSDLGHRIAGSPHALLDEVVHAVSDALRAPYAAVVLGGDDVPTAAVGVAGADTVAVPLTLRGMEVGRLVVGTRGAGEPYGRRDLDLLDDLAQHIAVAAHAAMLTRDLQRSRETLVVAREEERRRIRRDLHDGLGPALAGIAFGIDAARNTLSRDPAAADASLAELKAEVQASLADVRRLVYDLRPPALDQLGLVPAMEEYAARLRERSAVDVAVRSPAPLPALPAAVEVAAYRIATEALNNAVRHSRGRRTTVAFICNDGRLRVEVDDDGVGVPAQRSPSGGGVGLATMAERAAELGGSCVVLPRVGGGTSVVAELPLAVAS
jgi:signal transduction histidine kinase